MVESIIASLGIVLPLTVGGLYKFAGFSTRVAVIEQKQIDQLTLIDTKLDALAYRLERIEKALQNGSYIH